MRIILYVAVMIAVCATAADAQFAIYQATNSTTPAGGFLLDDSAGFLITPYPGKVFAR